MAQGEGIVAVAVANQTGNQVAQIDQGGQAFMGGGRAGIVMAAHGVDQAFGELPPGQEPRTHMGVFHPQ